VFIALIHALRWEGKEENEVGRCQETGAIHVKVDSKYYRPTEVVSCFKIVSSCLDTTLLSLGFMPRITI